MQNTNTTPVQVPVAPVAVPVSDEAWECGLCEQLMAADETYCDCDETPNPLV